jgi:hypothetical protein
MANLSRGITFGATEQVTNAKLHALVDSASIGGIVNADIDGSADISSDKINFTLSDYVTIAGAQTITGAKTFSDTTAMQAMSATTAQFSGQVKLNVGDPVADEDASRKKYVDDKFSTTAGHDHDGANSKQVDYSDIANAPDAPTETAWTDYSSTSTISGFGSYITKQIYYKQIGSTVFVSFALAGTSNSSGLTFTLPVAMHATFNGGMIIPFFSVSGSTTATGRADLSISGVTSQVVCYPSPAGGAWDGSGNKNAIGQFWYEAA